MSYLRASRSTLPKVDKTFVSPPEGASDESRKLLAAILNLADTLGLRTVAEGIEQADQAALLTDAGCHTGQGYLWSPALTPLEATELLLGQARLAAERETCGRLPARAATVAGGEARDARQAASAKPASSQPQIVRRRALEAPALLKPGGAPLVDERGDVLDLGV